MPIEHDVGPSIEDIRFNPRRHLAAEITAGSVSKSGNSYMRAGRKTTIYKY
jgi:hypothetical protein